MRSFLWMTDHPMFLDYDGNSNTFRLHLGGAFTSHTSRRSKKLPTTCGSRNSIRHVRSSVLAPLRRPIDLKELYERWETRGRGA